MAISLVDRRITACLEDATWELCFLGSAQIRKVPPADAPVLREQLLRWADASGAVIVVGWRGDPDAPDVWARLCG